MTKVTHEAHHDVLKSLSKDLGTTSNEIKTGTSNQSLGTSFLLQKTLSTLNSFASSFFVEDKYGKRQ